MASSEEAPLDIAQIGRARWVLLAGVAGIVALASLTVPGCGTRAVPQATPVDGAVVGDGRPGMRRGR